MTDQKQEAPSALATLCELRQGKTIVELSSNLGELVEAVRRTGKPGRLTLSLTVRPFSKGRSEEEVQVLSFEDAISMKLPQLERGSTVFFSDQRGSLARNDPRQMRIDELKEPTPPAPAAATDPKVVSINRDAKGA